MKASVSYSGRYYGNAAPATQYTLVVAQSGRRGMTRIDIRYRHAAGGFGVGWSQGDVTAASLEFSTEAAEALGQALMLSARVALSTPITMEIDERVEGRGTAA